MFLLLAALLMPVSAALAAKQVALVTAVSGVAEMELEKQVTPLSIGMELPAGAVVRVSSGTASIVFLEGTFVELKTGEQILLGDDPDHSKITTSAGTRGLEEEGTTNVAQGGISPGASQEQLVKLAYIPGVRGEKSVVALSPRLTISEDNPVFMWFDTDSTAAGTKRDYVITVRDASGNTLVQSEVEGKVFEINHAQLASMRDKVPAGAELKYSWSVQAKGSAVPPAGRLDAVFLYVDKVGLDQAKQKRMDMDKLVKAGKMDNQSYHTLLALYYADERERLFSDALPHLFELASAQGSGRVFGLRNMIAILNRFGNRATVVSGILTRQLLETTAK
jgi:hypothetical protein